MRLRALPAYVLLGALVTAVVAWSCALYADSPVLHGRRVRGDGTTWPFAVPAGWPPSPHVVFRGESTGYVVEGAQTTVRRPNPDAPGRFRFSTEHRVERHAFGWPWPALRWERRTVSDRVSDHHGLPVPAALEHMSRTSHRRLPLRPLWPGAAAGTAIFTAGMWILLGAPSAARRGVRAWRGRCAVCGYDLRGSGAAGCPECGRGR